MFKCNNNLRESGVMCDDYCQHLILDKVTQINADELANGEVITVFCEDCIDRQWCVYVFKKGSTDRVFLSVYPVVDGKVVNFFVGSAEVPLIMLKGENNDRYC
ncbi:hypothetical protein [Caviibacterium pharyngocola]|uniref:Uncharacterized protein n=1 Tax=Caviibacterium pharyngocola TaxID=28159 RepID=A0A2M8RTD3_9PAST|nr:hypothetical protein [Caviibacterium pharyngocola]PJG82151.1 hypothetical protein CVP04_10875 [Caviibacterium pharyngocola]